RGQKLVDQRQDRFVGDVGSGWFARYSGPYGWRWRIRPKRSCFGERSTRFENLPIHRMFVVERRRKSRPKTVENVVRLRGSVLGKCLVLLCRGVPMRRRSTSLPLLIPLLDLQSDLSLDKVRIRSFDDAMTMQSGMRELDLVCGIATRACA